MLALRAIYKEVAPSVSEQSDDKQQREEFTQVAQSCAKCIMHVATSAERGGGEAACKVKLKLEVRKASIANIWALHTQALEGVLLPQKLITQLLALSTPRCSAAQCE